MESDQKFMAWIRDTDYTTTLILKTIAFTHFFKDCFNEK